ncbi:MAG: uroporphyrinogen-III synthase [Anaeromyxobacteraceae bacterium]
MALSLSGRRIVLTRAAGADDALAARLRALGAEVVEFPAIALGPPTSFAALDLALVDVARVDWIAFASANAVERAAARAAELAIPAAALARPRLAAVGRATAERVALLLRAPDLVPEVATGTALAAALAPEVRGRRVLVPRAEEGRAELVDGLAAAGAEVIAPAAYRTVAADAASLVALGELLDAGRVDAVVFASPSAVRSVVAALGAARLARAAVAVIGPTTAEEARALGLVVAVEPSPPGAAALAEALRVVLGPREADGAAQLK